MSNNAGCATYAFLPGAEDLEDSLNEPSRCLKLEQYLMSNKEVIDWYNRVMHWTYRNRSAYMKIVLIQLFITLVLLSFSSFFVYRIM